MAVDTPVGRGLIYPYKASGYGKGPAMQYIIDPEQFAGIPEVDHDVASIGYWYFRAERAWVVQKLNANADQVGEAEYIYSGKADALTLAARWAAEYGVQAAVR